MPPARRNQQGGAAPAHARWHTRSRHTHTPHDIPPASQETKYCQESTCLSDYSLNGYILVTDDPAFAIDMPSSGDTATFTASWAAQGQPAQTRYHSHFNNPKPENEPGCVLGANGQPGPCWLPFVNLVSYHTHNTNDQDTHAVFMQVTNPTKSTTVKTGPSSVWFDQQYFEAHFGHPMQLDDVQNCFKVTSENGAEGVYIDNVAPYGLYGEDKGYRSSLSATAHCCTRSRQIVAMTIYSWVLVCTASSTRHSSQSTPTTTT